MAASMARPADARTLSTCLIALLCRVAPRAARSHASDQPHSGIRIFSSPLRPAALMGSCYEPSDMSAQDLARQSVLSVAPIRRAEPAKGETSMTAANDLALRRAPELQASSSWTTMTVGLRCDYEERLNGGNPFNISASLSLNKTIAKQKSRIPPESDQTIYC